MTIQKSNIKFLNFYLNGLDPENSTSKKREYVLRRFLTYLNLNTIDLQTIKSKDILNYINELHTVENIKATTLVCYFYFIKAFYRELYEEGLVETHFDRIFTRRMQRKLPKAKMVKKDPFSLEELLRVIGGSPLHLRAKLVILLNTGNRPETIGEYKIQDIDFEKKVIFSYEKKNDAYRIDPMHPETYKVLIEYYENYRPTPKPEYQDYFFITNWGNKWSYSSFWASLKLYSLKILGKQLTAKNFREFWASSLLQNKEQESTVQKMGGWKTSESLKPYNIVSPEVRKEIYDRSHPWFGKEKMLREKENLAKSKTEILEVGRNFERIFEEMKKRLREE